MVSILFETITLPKYIKLDFGAPKNLFYYFGVQHFWCLLWGSCVNFGTRTYNSAEEPLVDTISIIARHYSPWICYWIVSQLKCLNNLLCEPSSMRPNQWISEWDFKLRFCIIFMLRGLQPALSLDHTIIYYCVANVLMF